MATTVAHRTTCRHFCSPQRHPQLNVAPAATRCTSVSQNLPAQLMPSCIAGRGNSQSHLQVHPQQHGITVVARLDEGVAGMLRVPAVSISLLLTVL